MRNVVEEFRHSAGGESYMEEIPAGTTTWVPDPIVVPGTTYLAKARGRSDLIHGNHKGPTAYRAYRVDTTPSTAEISWDLWQYAYYVVPGFPTQRYWVRRTWRAELGMSSELSKAGMTVNYYPDVALSVKSEARNRALNKLNDSKVDLSETLGDIRQTGHMMANRLTQLVKAFNYARKGNAEGAIQSLGMRRKNTRKSASNTWLELQFGWLPLMSDIFNGQQAINDAFNRDPTFSVRAVATDNWTPSSTPTHFVEGNVESGCQVGLTMTISDAQKSALSTLGLQNPVNTAWQLLSHSFVIDWFISVGDYLSALGAPLGLTFLHGYETYWTRGEYTVRRKYILGTNPNANGTVYNALDVKNFGMARENLSGTPPPGMYMKSGLDFSKAITALALLNR